MNYYNSIAKGYDELHKEEQLNKLRIITKNLKIKKSDFLLDVGCGTAFSLEHFNCHKVGIDPAMGLLKQNKSRHNLIHAKAENLPFKDKSFDTVISITAIHNFDSVNKALKEIKRVVKNEIIITILKKSKKLNTIEKKVKEQFRVKKTIKEKRDTILFLGMAG